MVVGMSDWLMARSSVVASRMEDLEQAGLLAAHLSGAYLLVEAVVLTVDQLALRERLAQDPPAAKVLEVHQRLNQAAVQQRRRRVN